MPVDWKNRCSLHVCRVHLCGCFHVLNVEVAHFLNLQGGGLEAIKLEMWYGGRLRQTMVEN